MDIDSPEAGPSQFKQPEDVEDKKPDLSELNGGSASNSNTAGGPDSHTNLEADPVDDSDDSDTEDDPVIRTIPVFFTPALSKQTSLLCYPHKKPDTSTAFPLLPPSLRDVDHARQILARSKPDVGRLELSVPLEVESGQHAQRFNLDKARTYRQGVDARDLGAAGADLTRTAAKRRAALEGDLEGEKPLERITFRGEVVPDQTNYCVGILKDDQIHLTPLTQTVQLRPDLTYLDRLNMRSKRSGGADDDDDDDDDAAEEEANPAAGDKKSAAANKAKALAEGSRAVQVSIKESGSGGAAVGMGQANGRQDGSLFAPLRAEEAEEWVDLKVYPPTDEDCEPVWDALFSTKKDRLACKSRMTDHFPAAATPSS